MSLICGHMGEETKMRLFIASRVFSWSKQCVKWLHQEQKSGNSEALNISELYHWISSKFSFESVPRKFHTTQIHRIEEDERAADSSIYVNTVTKMHLMFIIWDL